MRVVALAIACLSSCQAQTEVARNSPLIVPVQASAIVQSVEPIEAGAATSVQAPAAALPAEPVQSLAFSADGKRLRVIGSAGESLVVFVLDVSSGTRLTDYRLPPNANYLGTSESLSYLAYRLAEAGPVTVVDIEQKTEQALSWLRLPAGVPLEVSLSNDGNLMSLGNPGDMSVPLEVYDLRKKARIFSRKLGVFPGGQNLIAVFPDGKYVRTGHNRDGWFVEKLSGGAKSLRLSILAEWSSDGRWAIEVPGMLFVEPLDCGPGEVPLKDGHTGRRVGGLDRRYAEEEKESAEAAFCGSSAVVFASFQTISIHRVPQGTELQRWTTKQLTGGEEDIPRPLACSPSGDRIALGAPRLQVIPVQPQP